MGRCALVLSCPTVGTIYPEPRKHQSTALAHQPWSLRVLSRDYLPSFLLLTSSIKLGYFANSRVVMSCLLPAGTLCACDIATLSPGCLLLPEARSSQTGKESPGAAVCRILLLAPHHPAALIEISVPFCLTACLTLTQKNLSQEGSDKLIQSQA